MDNDHDELPHGVQPLLPDKEDPLSMLVEEGVSEHVPLVVVLREGRC